MKIKEQEILNRYYFNFSKNIRKYFDSKKQRDFITKQLLLEMKTQKEINDLNNETEKITNILLNEPSVYDLEEKIQNLKEEKIKLFRNIFENYWFRKLKETIPSDENSVHRYVDALEKLEKYIGDTSLYKNLMETKESKFKKLLYFFPVWITTNLSAKNSIPLKENIFDLLVIDEASQCDIASALPLFYRTKQVVIICDTKQLKHISTLIESEDRKLFQKNKIPELYLDYSYSKNSLYNITERIIKNKNKSPILLNKHYRSHEDIIGFSNKYFYNEKLSILTNQSKLIPDSVHPSGISGLIFMVKLFKLKVYTTKKKQQKQ